MSAFWSFLFFSLVCSLFCFGEKISSNGLFAELDDDGDGLLELHEIDDFISEDVGGQYFDDKAEISQGTREVMENVLNKKNSKFVTLRELKRYWKKIGAMLTVEEVALWVEHSVLLPQFVENFHKNAISGYDFPTLAQKSGIALETELGITSALHRKQLLRAIQMRLLGVGDEPAAPIDFSLTQSRNTITVMWQAPPALVGELVPVHRYVVQRRISLDKPVTDWKSICVIPASSNFCLDEVAPSRDVPTYEYRIQAWNLLGHSNFTISNLVAAYDKDSSTQIPTKKDFLKSPMKNSKTVSESEIFKDVDDDGDGVLERNEILKYISENEANETPEEVLENLSGNSLKAEISSSDLEKYWSKALAMSVDDVCLWLEHAVLLPQLVALFRSHAVTGFDFPTLLEGNALSDLGVDVSYRKQVSRAIKMKLMAMGDPAYAVSKIEGRQNSDGSVSLTWSVTKSHPAVHRFVVERRKSSDVNFVTVCTTSSDYCIDSLYTNDSVECEDETVYIYRILSWNLLGHSPFSDSVSVVTKCDNDLFKSTQSIFGISASYIVTSIQALFTLGFMIGLVILFFTNRWDLKIGYFIGYTPETIVTSSDTLNLTKVMDESHSSTDHELRRRRREQRDRERATRDRSTSENKKEGRKLPELNAFGMIVSPPKSIEPFLLHSISEPTKDVGEHEGTLIRRASTDPTGSSSRSNSRSNTPPPQTGRITPSNGIVSEQCYICHNEFGFKDVSALSLNPAKWYRVKHFCCICNESFCSRCGTCSHKIAPCPVHGNCVCSNCETRKNSGSPVSPIPSIYSLPGKFPPT